MLIDLLNSTNYIMVNRDAIEILGLNAAVYCSELLNIYKKAAKKKAWYNETYFKVDREYVKKQTSLDIEDQLKCDLNLSKVNIIKIDPENTDIIEFNVETFASVLSSEDVKILESVSKKVKVENPKGLKKSNKEYVINSLKESLVCSDTDILFALKGWIDSIFESGKGMSKIQVNIFKEKLDSYCKNNKEAYLKIIEIATVHSYIDCQWAINIYENNNKKSYFASRSTLTFSNVNNQRTTTAIGDEVF